MVSDLGTASDGFNWLRGNYRPDRNEGGRDEGGREGSIGLTVPGDRVFRLE